MNPGDTWVHEEPMVGLEPTTGGLQNRFQVIAEYHSCSVCLNSGFTVHNVSPRGSRENSSPKKIRYHRLHGRHTRFVEIRTCPIYTNAIW